MIGAFFSRLMIAIIRLYQYSLSPLVGFHCRYHPTCSVYAVDAIKTHGPVYGGFLACKRMLRCHPWGGYGEDPVPPKKETIKDAP